MVAIEEIKEEPTIEVIEDEKNGLEEDEETKEWVEEMKEWTEETKESEAKQGAEEEEEVEGEKEETDEDLVAKSDASVLRQLGTIAKDAKMGLEGKKYNFAHERYKEGLRSIADWLRLKKDDPEMCAFLEEKQKLMAVNGALSCIKIGHYEQGLECAQLVLDKGALTPVQNQKALFRAGVCCRGMGDLKEAKKYFHELLKQEGIDGNTKRAVYKELKIVKEEGETYKKFAQNMCSGKGKEVESMMKKSLTETEIKKQMEIEEKRERYVEAKKQLNSLKKEVKKPVSKPTISLSEEDCIDMLDTLIERYSDKAVIDEMRQATMDHEYKFSKGFIIRSRMILEPLQKDVLEKYGFLEAFDDQYNSDVHNKALMEAMKTIRYLGSKNDLIAKKAEQAKDLAYGGAGGLIDSIDGLGSQ